MTLLLPNWVVISIKFSGLVTKVPESLSKLERFWEDVYECFTEGGFGSVFWLRQKISCLYKEDKIGVGLKNGSVFWGQL